MSTFALICLISSFIIYLTYIVYTYIKYKPSCISETYYRLKYRNLFTIWILLVPFLIFPAWVEISPINFQFLSFLSVVFLASIGIVPKYLEDDRIKHIIFTIIACVISLIWDIVTGNYFTLVLLSLTAVLLLVFRIKNNLFWIENLAFLNIYLSII